MNKGGLIVKLVLLVVLFALLLALGLSILCGGWSAIPSWSFHFGERGSGDETLVSTDSFAADSLTAIDATTASMDVSIIPGGNTVEVRFYSNVSSKTDRLSVAQSGKTLMLRQNRDNWFSSFSVREHVEIMVPADRTYDYTVSTASGGIALKIPAKKVSLTAVSGDVDCESSTATELRLKTTSGEIICQTAVPAATLSSTSGDVSYTGKTADLSIHTVSGEIEATLTEEAQKCRTGTTSGETELTMVGVSGYNVDFSSVSGDLSDKVGGHSSSGSCHYVVGDGALAISMDSVSGSARVSH